MRNAFRHISKRFGDKILFFFSDIPDDEALFRFWMRANFRWILNGTFLSLFSIASTSVTKIEINKIILNIIIKNKIK